MTIPQVYIKGFIFLCIIILMDLQFQYGIVKKIKQNKNETKKRLKQQRISFNICIV